MCAEMEWRFWQQNFLVNILWMKTDCAITMIYWINEITAKKAVDKFMADSSAPLDTRHAIWTASISMTLANQTCISVVVVKWYIFVSTCIVCGGATFPPRQLDNYEALISSSWGFVVPAQLSEIVGPPVGMSAACSRSPIVYTWPLVKYLASSHPIIKHRVSPFKFAQGPGTVKCLNIPHCAYDCSPLSVHSAK